MSIKKQINLHENMVMEFRMPASNVPMLLTEAFTWKDILSDIVQAAASAGAIVGTGGAGGDVVVDVMFALKVGNEILETVEALIDSLKDLGASLMRVFTLDISMGSAVFFEEVDGIIKSLIKSAGEMGTELIEELRVAIDEIIGKVTRAISKWVASILPDDFGLAGPAFEMTVTHAISSVAENAYNMLITGISALGETGDMILNKDMFEAWLNEMVDSVIHYANEFLVVLSSTEDAGILSNTLARMKFSGERLTKALLPDFLINQGTKMGVMDNKGFVGDYMEVLPTIPTWHPQRKLITLGAEKTVEWLTNVRAETVPVAATILNKLVTYMLGSVAVLQVVASYEIDEVPGPTP